MVDGRQDENGKGVGLYPWFLRYFWFGYAMMAFFTLMAYRSAFQDVLHESNFLDPVTVEAYVKTKMKNEKEIDLLKIWRDEAELVDFPILRYFSLIACVFPAVTLAVCMISTYYHVRMYPHSPDSNREGTIGLRDKTLRIIALPVVYGLLSFQGVVRMWGIILNNGGEDHFQSWRQRKAYESAMYETTFVVADLYESYALFVFGLLIVFVLKKALLGKINDAEQSKLLRDTSGSTTSAASTKVEETVRDLVDGTKGLTVLGIKLFCFTCFGQAVYCLVLTTASYYNIAPSYFSTTYDAKKGDHIVGGFFQTEHMRIVMHYGFYGAGFIASFAAIGNVVEVERGFHKDLTATAFRPVLKFLGTKVIVSLAFLQTIALEACPPFCSYSETRRKLLYAALLCYECCLISILHLKAWPADEDWYGSSGDVSSEAAAAARMLEPLPE